jgi:hypothetical protein
MDAEPRHPGGERDGAVPHAVPHRGRHRPEGRLTTRNMPTLRDLASTVRSKNAGVDHITFDIIFRDRANFERCATAR